jgi:hypothetical protein
MCHGPIPRLRARVSRGPHAAYGTLDVEAEYRSVLDCVLRPSAGAVATSVALLFLFLSKRLRWTSLRAFGASFLFLPLLLSCHTPGLST